MVTGTRTDDVARQILDSEDASEDVGANATFTEADANVPVAQRVSLRATLRGFFRLARPFMCDRSVRLKAWCLIIIVVLLELSACLLAVWSTYMMKSMMDAGSKLQETAFWTAVKSLALASMSMFAINSAAIGFVHIMNFEWRRYITTHLISEYVDGRKMYYHLKLSHKCIDNPDARIAQGIQDFCTGFTTLVAKWLKAIFTVVTSSWALYKIEPILLAWAFGLSLLLTLVIVKVFGGPLMRREREVLKQEADLRFGLIRLRTHAESVAFLQGENFERTALLASMSRAVHVHYRKLRVTLSCICVQRGLEGAARIVPYLVVAPRLFRGEISIGQVSQCALLFMSLFGSILEFADEIKHVAILGANAVRIQQFQDAVDRVNDNTTDRAKIVWDPTTSSEEDSEEKEQLDSIRIALLEEDSIQIALIEEDTKVPIQQRSKRLLLRLSSVFVRPPTGDIYLISNLSFELHEGESLLISGESGCGKSSLLRAISGIWRRGAGTVERHGLSDCYFLPQQPYICMGSLRQNATYPPSGTVVKPDSESERDQELMDVLKAVGLGELLGKHGLDNEVDFDDMLSGGERQKLGFARLQLQKQLRLVLLDESTSAMDEANEAAAYELMKRQVSSFISIGHRPQLERFHSHKLPLVRRPGGAIGRIVKLR